MDKFVIGLIVKEHKTSRKDDKDPKFKVVLKSRDGKMTANLESSEMGRHIFMVYPLGQVVEVEFRDAGQATLDGFGDPEADKDEDNEDA